MTNINDIKDKINEESGESDGSDELIDDSEDNYDIQE